MMRVAYDLVIPTIGRPSLAALLDSLEAADPQQIVVVDDRPNRARPLEGLPPPVKIVRGRAAGPAAARNVGWRMGQAPWVVFLDDDVEVTGDWAARLQEDLAGSGANVGGSQGRISVPVPVGRLTDWQRNVQGLERARWATADMAYRREILQRVGGFDERFRRAYREDADLALRVMGAGYRLVVGERTVRHPVRPASPWISVRLQRGNSDDVLMNRLHGQQWREAAGAPRGQLGTHRLVTACALLTAKRRWAALLWLAGTARMAYRRIAPGPRSGSEIATMLATSAAIPPVATYWWLHGLVRWRQPSNRPAAVLFDRDGTLVHDVPYNGDPNAVVPVPGARQALDRVRRAGLPIGVVSNQSGVGRGWLRREQVEAVNCRVEELLGPIDVWRVCPHTDADGCDCRKPAPGLILSAAAALGVDPQQCAVIGDIGADVVAGRAAGARAILVPTPVTRPAEVSAAPEVAGDLKEAVNRLLGSDR